MHLLGSPGSYWGSGQLQLKKGGVLGDAKGGDLASVLQVREISLAIVNMFHLMDMSLCKSEVQRSARVSLG